MRVPQSTPSDLVRDGASVRIWHDSWAKLKELARLKGKRRYETFDIIVTEALQAEWDRIIAEGDTPPPLVLPERRQG